MNPAPVSVIFTTINTATLSEYLIVDPNGFLNEAGAIRVAKDKYYYSDAINAKAQRAEHWRWAGAYYDGWLVKVYH